jgi:hypothetical protein
MRLFLFISLIVSMAVSPAIALASCASMGGDAYMTKMMAADQQMTQMTMDSMAAGDCDDMGGAPAQTHDAGCAAACALVCPGFYSGPDPSADQEPAFRLVQYAIPQIDPGLAAPSHLDPPPPRF